jgi:signal transduction histidine kinase
LATFIILFAVIIVNQEYKNYNSEIQKLQHQLKNSPKEKNIIIENKKQEYKKRLMKYSIGVSGLALFLFLSVLALSRVISNLVEMEIETFLRLFANATENLEYIQKDKFDFKEFQTLTDDANKMVQNIKRKNSDLIKLNNTLEDKVIEKTKKIEIKNKELINSKEKIETLLKSQDDFIKKSIHEINTPINIILANIELFRLKNGTNKHIKNIESGAKTIHNIFNDLSYLIKRDRIEYKKTKIDFSEFLKSRIDFFYEIANGSDLFFKLNIQNGVVLEYNDTQLQRIVDNNLSNAIKYSYTDTIIDITLKNNPVTFVVKTNSKKIENTKEIFNQYYRENESRGGFGIGLNIVKEICIKNDTKINIISNDEFTQFEYIFS